MLSESPDTLLVLHCSCKCVLSELSTKKDHIYSGHFQKWNHFEERLVDTVKEGIYGLFEGHSKKSQY